MAVRFLIGRAGSGKTHHCLHAIRERLRIDAVDGPRLLFLVPEQASLQMERAILEPIDGSSVTAVHRAEVLSFRRLAQRILDTPRAPHTLAMTDQARAMVLRHLITTLQDRFRYYRVFSGDTDGGGLPAGLIQRLSDSMVELMEESVSPSTLLACADSMVANSDGDRTASRAAKLHDLGLLYSAYLEFLDNDKLDPSQFLQSARQVMDECRWLSDFVLWVDGFASLSMQEILTLEKLVMRSRSTDITMMMDPKLIGPPGISGSPDDERIFRRTHQTYLELVRRFQALGVPIDEPLRFPKGRRHRFARQSTLCRLERHLFDVYHAVEDQMEAGGDVSVVALESRQQEVEYAVARICRWVRSRNTNYRYRDVAIIARNLEPYAGLLTEALTARSVPHFMDCRRTALHHPLVELFCAGADLISQSFSIDAVRRMLKTGLLGLSMPACDALENYVLAHGVSGTAAWRHDWSMPVEPRASDPVSDGAHADRANAKLDRINQYRRQFLDAIEPLLSVAAGDHAMSGAKWSTTYRKWIGRLDVARRLAEWTRICEEDAAYDEADEHRQVWREVLAFLDDAQFALRDTILTPKEWSEVLNAGFSALTLGFVPPTLDQVLVGSIERSRHPAIKAAVLIGFNDGEFPQRMSEDAVLNDDDRSLLESEGLRLRPTSQEQARDESMLAYVALTRASEKLVITYASTSFDGKPLHPSPYVTEIGAACGVHPRSIAEEEGLGESNWDIHTVGDLARRLVSVLRKDATTGGAHIDPSLWMTLYDTHRADLTTDRTSRWALRGLAETSDDHVSPAVMRAYYTDPMTFSVSRLESYAKCPFRHFAEYVLNLRPRDEAPLRPIDVGRVHHEMLERFVAPMIDDELTFGELTDHQIENLAETVCTQTLSELPLQGRGLDARSQYLVERGAAMVVRVIRAQCERSGENGMRPRAVERRFGFGESGGLDALEIGLPDGQRLHLRGVIDRLDTFESNGELVGLVVDYKSGRKRKLHPKEVYEGLTLQLLTYLLVLREVGVIVEGQRLQPAGALYVSLASQYANVTHPREVSARDALQGGTARPRGILNGEYLAALEPGGSAGDSTHYQVFRKKDGMLGHRDRNDAVEGEEFHAILDFAKRRIARMAEALLGGRAVVEPYRSQNESPCTWCSMMSVCRFEMGLSEVRFLESMNLTTFLQRIHEVS